MLRENSSSSLKSNNVHPVVQSAATSDVNSVVSPPSSLTSSLLNGQSTKIINSISNPGNTILTSIKFREEEEQMIRVFDTWTEVEQTAFVESLLSKMSHCQHSQINSFLKPMLQRDFISLLPSMLSILSIALLLQLD